MPPEFNDTTPLLRSSQDHGKKKWMHTTTGTESNESLSIEPDDSTSDKARIGTEEQGELSSQELLQSTLQVDDTIRLVRKIMIDLAKHQIAHEYFSKRQFWVFTLPTALLTLVSSILAFMACSSELLRSFHWNSQVVTFTAGALSAFAVFLQSLSGKCNYEKRAMMHDAMVHNFRKLKNELLVVLHILFDENRSTQSKIRLPHKIQRSPTEIMSFSDRYREYQHACNEFPLKINALFDKFELEFIIVIEKEQSRIPIYDPSRMQQKVAVLFVPIAKKYGTIDNTNASLVETFEPLFESALKNIVSSCVTSFLFPFVLPNPDNITKKTMEYLKHDLDIITGVYRGIAVKEIKLLELKGFNSVFRPKRRPKYFTDIEEGPV